jgi:hypothetical protein
MSNTQLIEVTIEPPAQMQQPLALPANQPTSIIESFGQLFAQAEEWRVKAHAIRVTDVAQKAEIKMARESRLALRRIRCDVENRRKALKEDALRTGQTIDGIARVFRDLVEPIEAYLEHQETFPERLAAAQREARRAERSEALTTLQFDASSYSLGEMPEDQFQSLITLAQNMKAAREEAARKAEEERIRKAQEAEAERVRREEEFRKAKEEAEAARKAQAEAEKARREAEEKAKEAARKAQAERERVEAQLRAERQDSEAKLRAENEARETEERSKRLAAEAEARNLREAEEARVREEVRKRKEEAERIEAAARAGDDEKLAAFAIRISEAYATIPDVNSQSAKAKLSAFSTHINNALKAIQ